MYKPSGATPLTQQPPSGQESATAPTSAVPAGCTTAEPCPPPGPYVNCDLDCFTCESDETRLLAKVQAFGYECGTVTRTFSPTPTPSSTASQTPTETPLPTNTSTFTPLPTKTATSASPSPSPAPTNTATHSPTPTPRPTLTPSGTHTPSPSATRTPNPTATPTVVPPVADPTPGVGQCPVNVNCPTICLGCLETGTCGVQTYNTCFMFTGACIQTSPNTYTIPCTATGTTAQPCPVIPCTGQHCRADQISCQFPSQAPSGMKEVCCNHGCLPAAEPVSNNQLRYCKCEGENDNDPNTGNYCAGTRGAVRLVSRAVVLTVAVTAVRITANPTWAAPAIQGKARAVDNVATQQLRTALLLQVSALHPPSTAPKNSLACGNSCYGEGESYVLVDNVPKCSSAACCKPEVQHCNDTFRLPGDRACPVCGVAVSNL